MKRLTVQLDEATIIRVRALAARRSTSVSRLIADEITRLAADDDYRRARETAIRQLEHGFRMGGGSIADRDSRHER